MVIIMILFHMWTFTQKGGLSKFHAGAIFTLQGKCSGHEIQSLSTVAYIGHQQYLFFSIEIFILMFVTKCELLSLEINNGFFSAKIRVVNFSITQPAKIRVVQSLKYTTRISNAKNWIVNFSIKQLGFLL